MSGPSGCHTCGGGAGRHDAAAHGDWGPPGIPWTLTPAEETCNGLCLHASDVGVPVSGDPIAYAHPDCPAHGDDQ